MCKVCVAAFSVCWMLFGSLSYNIVCHLFLFAAIVLRGHDQFAPPLYILRSAFSLQSGELPWVLMRIWGTPLHFPRSFNACLRAWGNCGPLEVARLQLPSPWPLTTLTGTESSNIWRATAFLTLSQLFNLSSSSCHSGAVWSKHWWQWQGLPLFTFQGHFSLYQSQSK